jgi:AcrR family transcriptional regulator
MGHELSPEIRRRRRDRILEAAKAVFLEQGYAGASMSLVSQRLGGSKATLYAYFRNKDELCEAIAQRFCEGLLQAVREAGAQPDLEGRLMHLGVAFLRVLASDEGVRLFQLAIEGSRTNPDLARRFEAAGLRPITERLAELLEDAEAQGEICAPDPVAAANVLVSLIRGDLHLRRLLNLSREPTEPQMRAELVRAIGVFMRAFAPATA